MSKSKVSIIIRTKNEERWIGHCLKRIHSQNYENYEIILVDSDSEDNTVEKAQRIGIDKLVKIKNYRPGFAINEGINVSSGEFIIILSAHCLPISNNWIKEMVDEISSNEKIVGVYGKQVPMDFSSNEDKRDLLIVFGDDPRIQIKDTFFHNANSIIKKEIWNKFKFDNNIKNIEDRIWAKKVLSNGYQIKYTPDGAVYHYHGIHQSGNAERLAGVTKIIQQLDGQYKPGLIDPAEYETCLVIPIRGKPLTFRNISQLEFASSSIFSNKHINKFFVATDSEYTASHAKELGFKVVKIRDESLSTPESTIEDVQCWHLNYLEDHLDYHPDVIVHAEITFPYRPPNLLDELIECFSGTGADTVLPAKTEFTWAWKNNSKDNLIRLDDGDIPRKYKKSLLLGSHGLGCVSHAEVIRRNTLVGEKVHLMPINNQLNFIEVRTQENADYFSKKISF
jgi:glycosyltransferase involved in cell wall biosynthesis